jgi:hypothetical protein
MAHFAKIDENNIVTDVIVVNNTNIINPETGSEDENIGINYCKLLFGLDTDWVQTSITNSFRGNFAGIGYSYERNYDIFLPPKPYESWIVDLEKSTWKSPIPKPSSDEYFKDTYMWIEDKKIWFSIKEYIYDKYAKDFQYSDIEEVVNQFNLTDNKIVIVRKNEYYSVAIEKVKNYIHSHISYIKWNKTSAKEWLCDYENYIKYNLCNTVRFTAKYCPTEELKRKFKNFAGSYADYYFLEEINDFIIFKRDKSI